VTVRTQELASILSWSTYTVHISVGCAWPVGWCPVRAHRLQLLALERDCWHRLHRRVNSWTDTR